MNAIRSEAAEQVGLFEAGGLDASALSQVIALLCRAFAEDGHIQWMVRQDGGRLRAMEGLFRLLLDPARGGRLHVTTDLSAVALWLGPDAPRGALALNLAFFARYLTIAGWASAFPKAWRLKRLQSLRPAGPHYYLQLLAVDPSRQGRGLGTALLTTLTARCDRDRLPAYLETTRARNCDFYARHGFETVAETRLSGDCVLWSMVRRAVIGAEGAGRSGAHAEHGGGASKG